MSQNKCKVEVFSRVTGFFRPVQTWNEGKTMEFQDRKSFNMETMVKKDDNCGISKAVTG